MSDLFDSNFINKIQRLVISTRLVMPDGAAGNRKSRSKGSSVEFSDYREYSAGDDYRRVDWNAYGRFEKLFIKLFMEERESPVNIFLDTSRSMDWGEPNKSIASRRLAAALGFVSLSNYDRVSLICTRTRAEASLHSLRGKNSFPRMLDFLENVKYEGETDLLKAVTDAGIKAGKGITVVISDLFSKGELDGLLKYLLFRKQEVFICHILCPQEIAPEVDANLRLIDRETGEYVDVTATSQLIRTYGKVFDRFVNDIETSCARRGAVYARMDSTVPVEQMVNILVNGGAKT